MKTTIQKLQISPADYEFIVLNAFSKWCMKHSYSSMQCQKLLTNQNLFRWFMCELFKIEEEFHNMTDKYQGLSPADYTNAFNRCLEHIYNIYPKALIESITQHDKVLFMSVFGQKVKLTTISPN